MPKLYDHFRMTCMVSSTTATVPSATRGGRVRGKYSPHTMHCPGRLARYHDMSGDLGKPLFVQVTNGAGLSCQGERYVIRGRTTSESSHMHSRLKKKKSATDVAYLLRSLSIIEHDRCTTTSSCETNKLAQRTTRGSEGLYDTYRKCTLAKRS